MRLERGTVTQRTALFGGRGTVSVWNLLGRQNAPPFSAVLSCELAAHGSVGAHVQEEHPEIVIGLEGEGEAIVDGARHALEPGSVVFLPFGSQLAITNLGDEPLRYLIIKAKHA